VAAVLHHLAGDVDGMADVGHRADRADPQLGALHHPRVKLGHAVKVERRTDASVQQRVVLHQSDRGQHRLQGTGRHPLPARLQRPLHRSLALGPFVQGRRSGAAVDDQGSHRRPGY
jgi:hypothetical protein